MYGDEVQGGRHVGVGEGVASCRMGCRGLKPWVVEVKMLHCKG